MAMIKMNEDEIILACQQYAEKYLLAAGVHVENVDVYVFDVDGEPMENNGVSVHIDFTAKGEADGSRD